MRNFTEYLGELESGHLFNELNEKMGDVIQGVQEHKKVGELTLKLKLKPAGHDQVEVYADVSTKVPEPPRRITIMFIDEHGALRREDPRQQKMELRDVTEETKELREVEDAPQEAIAAEGD